MIVLKVGTEITIATVRLTHKEYRTVRYYSTIEPSKRSITWLVNDNKAHINFFYFLINIF